MGKRRANGEGTIFEQKAHKRWVAELTRYSPEGKKNTKTFYGKTQAEVREKLDQYKADLNAGLVLDAPKLTLSQYLTMFLDNDVRPRLRPATYTAYEVIVRCHLVPHIGAVKLDKLNREHVKRLDAEMAKAKKSPRTRQFAYTILRKALDEAMRSGYITRNPAALVKRPTSRRKVFQPFDQDQARRFLEAAAEDRLHALYVLAIATGMRQGELFALQWKNIDLESGRLSVRHTLQDQAGKLVLGEPKTQKGNRLIKLPEAARQALVDHRQRMLAEGIASEWVFCDRDGGPLRAGNVHRRSFKPLLKKAGVPEIRFHDLRHTAATLMLLAGVHPKVVQEILGHAQISVTLDTYSHVLPSMQDEAASAMNAILTDG